MGHVGAQVSLYVALNNKLIGVSMIWRICWKSLTQEDMAVKDRARLKGLAV